MDVGGKEFKNIGQESKNTSMAEVGTTIVSSNRFKRLCTRKSTEFATKNELAAKNAVFLKAGIIEELQEKVKQAPLSTDDRLMKITDGIRKTMLNESGNMKKKVDSIQGRMLKIELDINTKMVQINTKMDQILELVKSQTELPKMK